MNKFIERGIYNIWIANTKVLYLLVALNAVVSHTSSALDSAQAATEYCASDTFTPSCTLEDEVVIITSAEYGAPSAGKCAGNDPVTGCKFTTKIDVKEFLDSSCSGRSKCNISVSDQNLTELTGCSVNELQISYICAKVSKDNSCRDTCNHSDFGLLLADGGAGYIAPTQPDRGCGSSTCTLVIQVQSGQQVKLVLLDFSSWTQQQIHRYKLQLQLQMEGYNETSLALQQNTTYTSSGAILPGESCSTRYGIIKEGANPKNKVLCADEMHRDGHIYTSISSTVELQLYQPSTSHNFLIHCEAIGCKDIDPPLYSRMSRREDKVLIECPADGQLWVVECVEGKWKGLDRVGVCGAEVHAFAPINALLTTHTASRGTNDYTELSFTAFFNTLSSLHLHKGILITLVIAIAFTIIVLIVTNGMFFMKKREFDKRCNLMHQASLYGQPCPEFVFQPDLDGAGVFLMSKVCAAQTLPCRTHRSCENLLNGTERQFRETHRPLPSLPRSGHRHSGDFTSCLSHLTYSVPMHNSTDTAGNIHCVQMTGENSLPTQRYPVNQFAHASQCGYPSNRCQEFPNVTYGADCAHGSLQYTLGHRPTLPRNCLPMGNVSMMNQGGSDPVQPRPSQQPERFRKPQSGDHTYFILDAEAVAAEPPADLVDPLCLPEGHNMQNNLNPDIPAHHNDNVPGNSNKATSDVTLLSPTRSSSIVFTPTLDSATAASNKKN